MKWWLNPVTGRNWRWIDLTGQRFGMLLVLRPAPSKQYPRSNNAATRWWCRCDCGKSLVVYAQHLVSRAQRRCRRCGIVVAAEQMKRRISTGASLDDLSRRTGISVNTLNQRLLRGWSEDRLLAPVNAKAPERQARRTP